MGWFIEVLLVRLDVNFLEKVYLRTYACLTLYIAILASPLIFNLYQIYHSLALSHIFFSHSILSPWEVFNNINIYE